MVSAIRVTSEARPSMDAIWAALAMVPDPEIPVISLVELGIVREVRWRDGELVVTLTPTYSGCPATEVIAADVAAALADAGIVGARIETRLSPAWTTDWIAPAAKRRLAEYGIAPPGARAAVQPIDIAGLRRRETPPAVPCPRCGSTRTRELSRFGSTPCKAQHRCEDCLEPFDYFKPH
ncbi:MAG TPA: 1,2-phenylacetyl-CoA epoxidase subunit PaaD [Casimicrobiaceae bacterium]|jgi:ring-1,2-phenylacetyl-CoA epoxidase subunit PaaD|nr:1,2-phenylacetyl-CoA epoxidase subunit PaaD [Casimicrobiaceae bacterium]